MEFSNREIHVARRMTNPSPPSSLKVTVAIATYNRADYLRQTLAGLVVQQFPRDHFEVIVIDNDSSDHTCAVVAEFASAHPAPRYVHEPRRGLSHARNRAIAEARGEIIVFGDDDILVAPDWLAQLTVPLLADAAERIGAVGGEVIPVFPEGAPAWIAEWHAPMAYRADAGPLDPRHSPMGANLAFRRAVLVQLGAFVPALGRTGKNLFGGDETEMIRRIRAIGLEVWFTPAAAVQHQMPASRTTFRYAARHAFDSARSRVIDRAGQPGAGGYFASRLIGNLLKALGFAVLALLYALSFQNDAAKKALVRAWRSCGYLYQIPRSLFGEL